MSSGLQYCRWFMSVQIPGVTDSFLQKLGYLPCVKSGTVHNARYIIVKLAGGTGAFVRFCGLASLEVSLDLLSVSGRGGLSVVSGHRRLWGDVLTSYLVLCRLSQRRMWKRVEAWRSQVQSLSECDRLQARSAGGSDLRSQLAPVDHL